LDQLEAEERWLPLDFGDNPPAGVDPADPPQLALRPGVWSTAYERAFYNRPTDQEAVQRWFEETLGALLANWRLFASEADRVAGRPLPVTLETFDRLPKVVREAVFRTIGKAVATDFRMPASGSPPGGSSRTALPARRKRKSTS
jgi:hypothetical protein